MKKALGALLFCLCLTAAAGAQFQAWDPTRNIPNGRVLGLGKAYLALEGDTGSIYTNPAGLAGIDRWQFSSMSGTFLEEYSYLSASGVYPTNLGIFGLGFAGSNIGGAYETRIKAGSDPNDPIYEIDTSHPPVSNYDNVVVLSWGNKAETVLKGLRLADYSFFNHPFFANLSVGASLKLFYSGLTGDEIAEGAGLASGRELSLGLQYQPPVSWLRFGLVGANLLPFSMGGKLSYATGHEEGYPAIIEAGAAVKLLGGRDAMRAFRDQEVTLLFDIDQHPTNASYPLLYHAGIEWKPSPTVALRAGLDQDAAQNEAGTGLEAFSNLTAGVGFYAGGFRFDYAYGSNALTPGITNSYFSLSYGVFPAKPAARPTGEAIAASPDKIVTAEPSVIVTGRVLNPDITVLKLNGEKIKLPLKREFSASADLKVGKNALIIEGYDDAGNLLGYKKLRILRLLGYPDVAPAYWAHDQIGYVGTMGIIKGYPDGTFRPEGRINRAEMATMLIRTMAGGDERVAIRSDLIFSDVPLTHWALKYINVSYSEKIVLGYPDITFRPSNNISRAEGLSMITRFSGVSQEAYGGQFADVVDSHWAAGTIAGAFKAGMLRFLQDKPFAPNAQLTRAESVELLYRSPYVREVLEKDLLNWNSY
ncbi:MAG: S-layer homology domain-containing protein [Candidatus Saganbacteria bacterium]|nr:S-layer homology domain-containing protein [Candidatus Saganbacteria bacterium]